MSAVRVWRQSSVDKVSGVEMEIEMGWEGAGVWGWERLHCLARVLSSDPVYSMWMGGPADTYSCCNSAPLTGILLLLRPC